MTVTECSDLEGWRDGVSRFSDMMGEGVEELEGCIVIMDVSL